MVQLLDPELIILSGGLAQSNPFLTEAFQQALETKVSVPRIRNLEIRCSEFGSHGGVMGAASIAMNND